MKILITGFEPFLENDENPTSEIIKLLPNSIYGNTIIKIELPVVFDQCFDELLPLIINHSLDIIINLGLSGERKSIRIERTTINIDDSKFPDNIGNIHRDKIIKTNGENAYFSSLPIRSIIKNIEVKKTPVIISNSAGTYVCNNLMYHVLHYIKENNLNIKAGFIHVQFMTKQFNKKSDFTLDLDIMLEATIMQ